MKTIKVIDLFQKKVEGKPLPQIIKIRNHTFELNEKTEDIEEMYEDGYLYWLRNQDKYNISLEDEVEIIEGEKEIEKLFHCDMKSNNPEINVCVDNINILSDKINELIDAVNELKRGN